MLLKRAHELEQAAYGLIRLADMAQRQGEKIEQEQSLQAESLELFSVNPP